jgi:hypothetical protein
MVCPGQHTHIPQQASCGSYCSCVRVNRSPLSALAPDLCHGMSPPELMGTHSITLHFFIFSSTRSWYTTMQAQGLNLGSFLQHGTADTLCIAIVGCAAFVTVNRPTQAMQPVTCPLGKLLQRKHKYHELHNKKQISSMQCFKTRFKDVCVDSILFTS